jgi:hypothetical protein
VQVLPSKERSRIASSSELNGEQRPSEATPSRLQFWLASTEAGRPATIGRRRIMLPSIPTHKTINTLHSHASISLAHTIVLLSMTLLLLDPQAYRNISGVNMTNNIKTNSSFLRSGSTTRTYSTDGVMGESENNVVGILKVEAPVASSLLTLGCA